MGAEITYVYGKHSGTLVIEHALRDALRGKDLAGVRRTSFGYHIDASALDEIKTTLGAPPPKGNASKRA
jgi:hypothetical protein